jgi:hypothetical protein
MDPSFSVVAEFEQGFYMLTHQYIGFYVENCLLTYSDMSMYSCFGVENSPEVCPSVF